jgi:hypothetical protein
MLVGPTWGGPVRACHMPFGTSPHCCVPLICCQVAVMLMWPVMWTNQGLSCAFGWSDWVKEYSATWHGLGEVDQWGAATWHKWDPLVRYVGPTWVRWTNEVLIRGTDMLKWPNEVLTRGTLSFSSLILCVYVWDPQFAPSSVSIPKLHPDNPLICLFHLFYLLWIYFNSSTYPKIMKFSPKIPKFMMITLVIFNSTFASASLH